MTIATLSIPAPKPAKPAGGQMSGDVTFSMFAKLLYLVTRLGLPPVILAHVTLMEYGLWSACFLLVGYIGLADLGFSAVYVRTSARLHAQGDTRGIGRLLSTGITCMVVISTILFAVIAFSLPAIMDLLKIDAASRATARVLLLGCVAVFLADMCLNAFAYVLHGIQKFRAEQKVWVLAFVLEMALIFAFFVAGIGIQTLLIAFAIRYAFSISCNIRQAYVALPGLHVNLRHFDASLLRHFLGFGLGVQASTFFAMALHSADRLVAGALLGPQAIAVFDLGGKLPVSATSVPGAISQVALPAAARMSVAGGDDTLCTLYAQTTRSVSLLAAIPLSFIAVFAVPFSLTWLGQRPELGDISLVMTLTALAAFMHIITGPGSSIFRGMGQLANEFVYHALRIVCLGIGVLAACALWGTTIKGVAFGLSAGAVVAACAYLVHNHRRIGLPVSHLFTKVLLPGAVTLVPAFGLYAIWLAVLPASFGRWPTLALLGGFGIVHCIFTGMALWLMLDNIEKGHLSALANRIGSRMTPWRNT